ncbi:2-oxo-4-hydroxy-4-carboxy-5-ureidoimidazoline decarboxylase-like [Diabrotica virgifera virgifera]|uniref:2-oxo-4-hydroxy-4-carboxy-5-ureidoimidazoline decarboxylase n=1 Tax=Diabrotica virgifera virgifera TaxID=50390 RepID=A0A6P7G8U7_DIAVI|nr:2-oxo-4-hydroxy-4-carboxy-5-ureidoimidazoline decarboxylase-like [Diabrotica virgifera virgifera]
MFVTHHFSIDEVNNLLSESFVRIFGNVVEHFPAAAIGILKCRPFNNSNALIQAICDFLDGLKAHEKEKIFQLYPDILDSALCTSPMIYDKEPSFVNIEEKRKLQELNSRYKDKFGYPFITTISDHNHLYSEIQSRMENNKDDELQRTLREVKAIVYLRVQDIVS